MLKKIILILISFNLVASLNNLNLQLGSLNNVYNKLVPNWKLIIQTSDEAQDIAISNDNKYVAYASNIIRVIDLERMNHFYMGAGNYTAVAISSDNKYIAAGLSDGLFELWHISSRSNIFKKSVKYTQIQSIMITNDNKYIIIGYKDGDIRKFDIEKRRLKVTIESPNAELVYAMLSKDNKYIVASYADDIARIWDFESATLVQELKDSINSNGALISPNNKYIVNGLHGISVWQSYEPSKWEIDHVINISGYKLAINNEFIIAGTGVGIGVYIWDIKNGDFLNTMYLQRIYANQFLISIDGKYIVASIENKGVDIYERV